jgi:TetR/AcrR family transcriptional repressor of nem operon
MSKRRRKCRGRFTFFRPREPASGRAPLRKESKLSPEVSPGAAALPAIPQTHRLHTYQPVGINSPMTRPTKLHPERGDARIRLLEAARDTILAKGFAATSVDDICRAAAVTKGSFFHHFRSKEELGVAVAQFWAETTTAFFAAAPYHEPANPLDRVLAYVAFRKSIIAGEIAEFSCLVGTMAQEVYADSPSIRDACGASIFGHAKTLEADIAAAIADRGVAGVTAESLARHTQTVIQGAFVLAKAGNDPALARESLDHLDHYFRLLFGGRDREEVQP